MNKMVFVAMSLLLVIGLSGVVMAEQGSSDAARPSLIKGLSKLDASASVSEKMELKLKYEEMLKKLKSGERDSFDAKGEVMVDSRGKGSTDDAMMDDSKGSSKSDLLERLKMKWEERDDSARSEFRLEVKTKLEDIASRLEEKWNVLEKEGNRCEFILEKLKYASARATENGYADLAAKIDDVYARLSAKNCVISNADQSNADKAVGDWQTKHLMEKSTKVVDRATALHTKLSGMITRTSNLVQVDAYAEHADVLNSAIAKLTALNAGFDSKIKALKEAHATFESSSTKENAWALRKAMVEVRTWSNITASSMTRVVFMFNHLREHSEDHDEALLDATLADIPSVSEAEAKAKADVSAAAEVSQTAISVGAVMSHDSKVMGSDDSMMEHDDSGADSPSDMMDDHGSEDEPGDDHGENSGNDGSDDE